MSTVVLVSSTNTTPTRSQRSATHILVQLQLLQLCFEEFFQPIRADTDDMMRSVENPRIRPYLSDIVDDIRNAGIRSRLLLLTGRHLQLVRRRVGLAELLFDRPEVHGVFDDGEIDVGSLEDVVGKVPFEYTLPERVSEW